VNCARQPQGRRSGEGTAGLWELVCEDERRKTPLWRLPQDEARRDAVQPEPPDRS
jgi:hypothetical protein